MKYKLIAMIKGKTEEIIINVKGSLIDELPRVKEKFEEFDGIIPEREKRSFDDLFYEKFKNELNCEKNEFLLMGWDLIEEK